MAHPRLHLYQEDGTLSTCPDNIGHRLYDVIIDDGSHDPGHQVATARIFAPSLSPGGLYVIEDVSDLAAIWNGLSKVADDNHLKLAVFDLRHVKGRYDDVVITMRTY